jgi:hypothetical protein
MTTLTEMRNFSNSKATILIDTNKEHPIRPFSNNLFKIDEYVLRLKTPKPIFTEQRNTYLGKLQTDMRKIKITPQYNRNHMDNN